MDQNCIMSLVLIIGSCLGSMNSFVLFTKYKSSMPVSRVLHLTSWDSPRRRDITLAFRLVLLVLKSPVMITSASGWLARKESVPDCRCSSNASIQFHCISFCDEKQR